ncbi:MAG TPA: trypsin-like peptidase domain-containing protein [Acidimicrobiales bacterium]
MDAGGAGRMAGGAPMLAAPAPGRPGRRPGHLATIGVGVGAAAAVLAGVLLLANAGSGNGPSPSSTADPPSVASAVSGCCKVVPTAAQATEQSIVALEVSTNGGGVAEDCGVAVAAGGLVVTTADAVDGVRSVTAVTANGTRVRAAVLAVDRGSDIALLRLDADLPVARFADDATVAPGYPAMVMALAARSDKDSDAALWADSSVESVATAIQGGDAAGLAALTTSATAVPAMPGEALLQPTGRVIGILDSTGRPASGDGEEAFLPSQLVVGVADALAQRGHVQHGWLDVKGRDAPASSTKTTVTAAGSVTTMAAAVSDGAQIVAVGATGPSAHALEPGDVIVSLDGAPVRSMAELRSRLYVLGPASVVDLDVERQGTPLGVDVTLASSP